jgi:transposase
MANDFISYDLRQQYLLPPDIREWLPDKHLARFIIDVLDELDLSELMLACLRTDERGRKGYHPRMLLGLLLYGYCTGTRASRQIEKKTYEDIAFRVLSGNEHPDHDTIATFRKLHLSIIAKLFVQVLRLCQEAGLVKLGNVSIDGSKIKANASKHKAMSYSRMCETEKRIEAEVKALLAAAAATDAQEDAQFGKGKRGDELPDELARRESRLIRIREAKAALEAAAKEKAAQEAAEAEAKNVERQKKEEKTGKKAGGRPAQKPDVDKAVPEPKAQRNFTDPESRIMKDGASKGFEQAYNAQIAVDGASQVIVASAVTQDTNDKQQLVPMVLKVKEQAGALPVSVCADAGYFSVTAITDSQIQDVDLFVPPNKQKHGQLTEAATKTPEIAGEKTVIDAMRTKVASAAGKAIYKRRKQEAEPVFGQIKEARGMRRFSFRGLEKVAAEWDLICLTHNLLKLFRSGIAFQGRCCASTA